MAVIKNGMASAAMSILRQAGPDVGKGGSKDAAANSWHRSIARTAVFRFMLMMRIQKMW
jgi:hypothetical protein